MIAPGSGVLSGCLAGALLEGGAGLGWGDALVTESGRDCSAATPSLGGVGRGRCGATTDGGDI